MADFESLHKARPTIDDPNIAFDWDNQHRIMESGNVVAHFGDLTDAAVQFIKDSPAVVGCIAWLTESRILAAMAEIPAAIVVQKEDFLRPEPGGDPSTVRRAYDRLSNNFARFRFPLPLGMASYAEDPTIDAVRCVGNSNADRSPAMPRMHHKFLVRINDLMTAEEDNASLEALAVWTGSFNMSWNAGRSFENAVEIYDHEIATAYLAEFARVAALSEPLDWTAPWVEAQWRMGT